MRGDYLFTFNAKASAFMHLPKKVTELVEVTVATIVGSLTVASTGSLTIVSIAGGRTVASTGSATVR